VRQKQNTSKAFGLALKNKRLEANLTQEDLAERSKLSTRYISRLECHVQQPNYRFIKSLAMGLDIKASELIQAVEGIEQELKAK
jgi:transcriptional regulator with XRE-family HTH domain